VFLNEEKYIINQMFDFWENRSLESGVPCVRYHLSFQSVDQYKIWGYGCGVAEHTRFFVPLLPDLHWCPTFYKKCVMSGKICMI
jgi:hypothetical protein